MDVNDLFFKSCSLMSLLSLINMLQSWYLICQEKIENEYGSTRDQRLNIKS